MKDARIYKEKLKKKIYELKCIDRSKYFSAKEVDIIDKVFSLVLEVIELDIDCD